MKGFEEEVIHIVKEKLRSKGMKEEDLKNIRVRWEFVGNKDVENLSPRDLLPA